MQLIIKFKILVQNQIHIGNLQHILPKKINEHHLHLLLTLYVSRDTKRWSQFKVAREKLYLLGYSVNMNLCAILDCRFFPSQIDFMFDDRH